MATLMDAIMTPSDGETDRRSRDLGESRPLSPDYRGIGHRAWPWWRGGGWRGRAGGGECGSRGEADSIAADYERCACEHEDMEAAPGRQEIATREKQHCSLARQSGCQEAIHRRFRRKRRPRTNAPNPPNISKILYPLTFRTTGVQNSAQIIRNAQLPVRIFDGSMR